MAYQDTDHIWNARGLDHIEKIILLRIADRMNHKHGGVAWMGLRALAKDTGLCLQTVTSRVQNLIGRGLVYVLDKPKHAKAQTRGLEIDFEAVANAARGARGVLADLETVRKPHDVGVLSRANLRSAARGTVLSRRTPTVLSRRTEQVIEQVVRTTDQDFQSPRVEVTALEQPAQEMRQLPSPVLRDTELGAVRPRWSAALAMAA